jgi:hypothetical protein
MMMIPEGSNEGTWETVHSKAGTRVYVSDKDVGFEGVPGWASELYYVLR